MLTYDVTTPVGLCRLLTADTAFIVYDEPDIVPGNAIFQDEEYSAFLGLNNQVVKLASAQALDVISINEVLVQKRIKLLDISTNGPDEAQRLMELSAELRRQSYEGDGDLTGFFDYAEVVYDAFTARQRVIEQWLRMGG